MQSIKVSNKDLSILFEWAKYMYKTIPNGSLTHEEIVARCYLDACDRLLNKKGIKLSISYVDNEQSSKKDE